MWPAAYSADTICSRASAGTCGSWEPKTISSRYQALRSFFDWLAAEAELDESPVRRVARPKVQEPEIRVPTLEELRAVLATASNVRAFADVRDAAVIRLWLDTGLRRSELAGLTIADVNVIDSEVSVMGKGRKPRTVAYGTATAKALGRYLRLRSRHPQSERAELWLGDRAGRRRFALRDADPPRGPCRRDSAPTPAATLLRRCLATGERQRGRPDARCRLV